jgi:hypothetical protein
MHRFESPVVSGDLGREWQGGSPEVRVVVGALLLVSIVLLLGCKGEAAGKRYAACSPIRVDSISEIGEGTFTAGAELIGTPVGLEVPIFTIESVSAQGAVFKNLGLAREGDFVIADVDSVSDFAQFRVMQIIDGPAAADGASVRIMTLDLATSRVVCARD